MGDTKADAWSDARSDSRSDVGMGVGLSAQPIHWWQMDAEPYIDSVGSWDLTEAGTVVLTANAAPDGVASAPHFSGAGDYLGITGRAWAHSQYSIAGFYKFDSLSSTGNYLMTLRDATTNIFSLALRNSGTDFINAAAWDEAQTLTAANPTTAGLSSGTWYHAMMAVDLLNNSLKLYIDGEFILESTTTVTTGETSSAPLYFGTSGHNAGHTSLQHLGYLAQWGMWDAILTEADAKFLYNG